ncbi:MAG: diguanylate cyclase [Hyphomicrobiales bacterium]|nr:diguanylate cyclase [Hyphomicrobiales bacterium]
MYQIITALSIDQIWLLTANLLLSSLLLLWVLRYRILYRNTKQEAQQHYNSLDELNEGFYRAKVNGSLTYANRAMVKLVGYENFEEFCAVTHNVSGAGYLDADRRKLFHEILMRDGYVCDFVSEIRNVKSGELIWISENAHLVTNGDGKNPTHYEGLMLNITDAVQREKLEDRIEKLADNLPGGLFQLHVNRNGNFSVPYASPGFHHLTGIGRNDLENPKVFLDSIHADHRERCAHSLSSSIETMCVWNIEFKIKRPIGNDCWVRVVATPERLAEGDIILHGHISDISERKISEGKIAYYAYYDALTGLPNRTLFIHHLEKAIVSSARTGIYKALLFLDIDDFKTLNDNYGHATGDLLLKKIANRLDKMIRSNDTASRFGGDEFILLLDAIGSNAEIAKKSAIQVASKIMDEFQNELVLAEQKYCCTSSIGIHVFNGDITDCDTLIRYADTAMYNAKKNGKNNIVVYDDCFSTVFAGSAPVSITGKAKVIHEKFTA